MKNNVLIAAVAVCALVCSCSKADFQQEIQEPMEMSAVDVDVHTSFSMQEDPWASTRAVTAEKADISRIILCVFDNEDKKVKEISQRQGDADFGTFSEFRLSPGSYKFVAVAHKTGSVDNGNIQIVSPTEAVIPDAPVNNTFACVKDVTVGGYQKQDVSLDLNLCVTALRIVAQDVLPLDVKYIEIVVNSEKDEATTLSFNPTTLLFNGNNAFRRKWDVSSRIGEAGLDFVVVAFLDVYPKTASASVRAYDTNDEPLFTRTFDNLTFKRATRLTVNTNLFTGAVEPSLTFEEWGSESVNVP